MAFYREGRSEGDFDAGIEKALSAVLVNPEFLFRVELDPDRVPAGAAYRISDLELASRLSFFLWSSIPDDELLDAAVRGDAQPAGRARATGPAHARRSALVQSREQLRRTVARGCATWSRSTRTCVSTRTSTTTFVRRSARRPSSSSTACCAKIAACSTCSGRTTPFSTSAWRSTTGFPTSTAAASGASRSRPDSKRGGLLRQGSILAVTSYATRTSPVIRGVWVLDNIFGAPPPPPLPNVPALEESVGRRQPADAAAAGRASQQPGVRELSPDDRPGRVRAGELRRRGSLAGS